MSDTILVIHGAGEGFSDKESSSSIAKLLNVPVDKIKLFDYSQYLNTIIWPRIFLFPITMWAKHNLFADQVGDITAWVGSGGAREKLASTFLKTIHLERPKYIIAHSLGTVIAYQALVKDNKFKGVQGLSYNPIFIGAGSPLHLLTFRQLGGFNRDHESYISSNSFFVQGKKDPITKWGKNPWKFLDNNINNLMVHTPPLTHSLENYLAYISKEIAI